jgi:hypothetical protein
MEDDKDGDASSHSFVPLASARRTTSLRLREAEALADSLEAQFHPVDDPSDPAVIEMVDKAMPA